MADEEQRAAPPHRGERDRDREEAPRERDRDREGPPRRTRPPGERPTRPRPKPDEREQREQRDEQPRRREREDRNERDDRDERDERDEREDQDREREQPAKKGLSTTRLAQSAVAQLQQLTTRDIEAVVGMSRNENGNLTVILEVVESAHFPDSADIMAEYSVEVDPQGDLVGYSRGPRYQRGRPTGK
ncbi:gas vesicle protein GvpO [Sinomonas humi]|uniref:gas vesicle protein GvpO n=1 Tax=Sinomonas humi TaxID=1338436 RepID=UPI00068F30D6|nr:gas vesicle protein GvpO [Sinomonas humi]